MRDCVVLIISVGGTVRVSAEASVTSQNTLNVGLTNEKTDAKAKWWVACVLNETQDALKIGLKAFSAAITTWRKCKVKAGGQRESILKKI